MMTLSDFEKWAHELNEHGYNIGDISEYLYSAYCEGYIQRGKDMKYSELKHIKTVCDGLSSDIDWREVVQANSDDFEVDGVRFIAADTIQSVLVDELSFDTYVLGSFTPYAIWVATGWPVILIEVLQDDGKYELIGDNMSREQIEVLADHYSSLEGYGTHFNSWDGSEEFITINNKPFYVFNNR